MLYRTLGKLSGPGFLLTLLLVHASILSAQPVDFIGIAVDKDAQESDQLLCKNLEESAQVQFSGCTPLEYGAAIQAVVNARHAFVAHLPPYAYVAAEMQGARFETVAIYKSKATQKYTYHSYLIVRRSDFKQKTQPGKERGKEESVPTPTLADIERYLKASERTFVSHDKFSTSSYFLPSLYFRSHGIFKMDRILGQLKPIKVNVLPTGKTAADSVQDVLNGRADIAAVWDGTLKDLTDEQKKSIFQIQLPDVLPNDLLVYSMDLDNKLKDRIRAAIRPGLKIGCGDIVVWSDYADHKDDDGAGTALADLQEEAMAPPAPTPIKIEWSSDQPCDQVCEKCKEAARRAIQLAGTEFVLFDKAHYVSAEVTWTLKLKHKNSLTLSSDWNGIRVPKGIQVPKQDFNISFVNPDSDLAPRIGAIVRSEMHRTRYGWPFIEKPITVIRDADFSLPADTQVLVSKITWLDPRKNAYIPSYIETTGIKNADLYKFELKADKVGGSEVLLDPMSNVAYKMLLVRPDESWLYEILAYVFVALFCTCGVGLIYDVRRKSNPALKKTEWDRPVVETGSFDEACDGFAASYLNPWRTRNIFDSDLFGWNRKLIEEKIDELKNSGFRPRFDETSRRKTSFKVRNIFNLKFGPELSMQKEWERELSVDPSKVGPAKRLRSLVPFLIENGGVSDFLGRPIEWDALERIGQHVFRPVDKGVPLVQTQGLLRRDHPFVIQLVAGHFSSVLDESRGKVSLFFQVWCVVTERNVPLLRHKEDFPANLPLELDDGVKNVRGLILEVPLWETSFPPGEDTPANETVETLHLHILAKVVVREIVEEDGFDYLLLRLSPLAIMRD